MNESDAKAALRAMGIFSPSRSLIQNWLRAAQASTSWGDDERGHIELPSVEPNTSAARQGGTVADIPISGELLNAAVRALEAQGLPTTRQAVIDWLAQNRPQRVEPVTAEQQPPMPQTSQLEPPKAVKKGASQLARLVEPPAEAKRTRKPGRPLTIASWFPAVTETMADGTNLRTALAIRGLTLSPNEMRSLYRNKTFKGLYQEARRRYLIENWGRSGPSLRAILGRCI